MVTDFFQIRTGGPSVAEPGMLVVESLILVLFLASNGIFFFKLSLPYLLHSFYPLFNYGVSLEQAGTTFTLVCAGYLVRSFCRSRSDKMVSVKFDLEFP